jgi:DNA-binding transcriptional LysR family regulator
MELSWLEDFLNVAETGNFTRSAQVRHMTQPALSRRIRNLEHWLGADLIDRSSYPTRLTPAGELFHEQATAIVEQLNTARALMRQQSRGKFPSIRFALPHTLSLSFFPRWLTGVHRDFGLFASQVIAGNVHDAVLSFVEGHSDALICYHHPAQPIALDAKRYPHLRLGTEPVRPYARADARGKPQFSLPGEADTPLPFLNYSADAYLRRTVDHILENPPEMPFLRPLYETAMAEGLKNMVLEGHGIAFLPISTAADDVRQNLLAEAGDTKWSVDLEIRLYRDGRRGHEALQQLWRYLEGSS